MSPGRVGIVYPGVVNSRVVDETPHNPPLTRFHNCWLSTWSPLAEGVEVSDLGMAFGR